MKVKKITVKNIRSISDLEFDFKGCSAIVTGRNAIGKSTFLRFLFDRLSGIIDKAPLWDKDSGCYKMEITDGEDVIELVYEVKKEGEQQKEKMYIIYPDGKKERLTKDIINKLYPKRFDIDMFLEMTNKEKLYYIANILGKENVKDILERIEVLRKDREKQYGVYRQKEKAMLEYKQNIITPSVSKEKLEFEKERINKELNEYNKIVFDVTKNNEFLDKTLNAKEVELKNNNNANIFKVKELQKNIEHINNKIGEYKKIINTLSADFDDVILVKEGESYSKSNFEEYFNRKISDLQEEIKSIKILSDEEIKNILIEYRNKLPYKEIPPKPDMAIYDELLKKEKEWIIYDEQTKELKRLEEEFFVEKNKYDGMTEQINDLEREIINIFSSISNNVIKFNFDGIYYKDKLIDKNKMATSEIYKSAIYLGALCLGEVRTLVFDISTFDKNSFKEILDFANENDIQILVERPDWDGDKIKIEIIEE